MLKRLLGCLALMVLVGIPAVGETLQDRKLPSPAVFEAVFPQVVFGSFGYYGRYETALILANPDNRPAQVELDFRYPDGQSAAELFTTTETLPPSTGPLKDNDCFYLKIPAHAARELALPGKDPQLVEKEFDGWVVLRSNAPIFAHQVFRVIDYRNVKAEVGSAAGYTATTRAEIEVGNLKWEPGDEGSAKWWGWNYEQTGIAVVNPFSAPSSIAFTLQGIRKGFELAPHTKRSFLIGELFPSFHANTYYSNARVLVEAQTSTPFVILGLDTFIDTDPNGLPDPGPDRPWLTFHLPTILNIPGGSPFSFPDEILAEKSLGARQILLSRLGFLVASPGEQSPSVFPVNLEQTRGWSVGIVSDGSLGLAVVYGATDIPVVFGQTGHVLRIPYTGHSRPQLIAGEKPGQVKVIVEIICQTWTHTIDVQAETLVSSKSEQTYCPL